MSKCLTILYCQSPKQVAKVSIQVWSVVLHSVTECDILYELTNYLYIYMQLWLIYFKSNYSIYILLSVKFWVIPYIRQLLFTHADCLIDM